MTIAQSIKGITDFWKSNQGLVKDIQEAGTITSDLGNRLDQNRKDGQAALAAIGTTPFLVAAASDARAAQAKLLQQIGAINQRIQDAADDPESVAGLELELATLYSDFGDTYNSLVPQIVVFTQAEVAQLQLLLQQATLDAVARQRRADLLNGAVQMSKFALGFALKLTA